MATTKKEPDEVTLRITSFLILAEISSASLRTQLFNASQGLHTISHTTTPKEAWKFS